MTRRTVALAAAVLAVAAAAVVIFGGEKVEHVISPETGALRPPSGEWIASVPGRRAEVWAVGDAGGDDSAAVARLIERAHADRVLYLGDVYPRGSAADFERFGRTFGPLLDRTAPTPGNHDWTEAVDGYEPFWEEVRGSPPPTYYAFRAGGWQILSVNSEHSEQDAVERWLESETASGGTCRVVYWHRARFSAGPHGDSKATQELWEAVRGRARILLAGHEHNMQRLRPIEGVVNFMSGAGGYSHHEVPDDPRLAFSNGTDHGALRLRLTPGRARWAFVAVDGDVLDSGSLRCRA